MSKLARRAALVPVIMLLGIQLDSQAASGQTSCDTVVTTHNHYYCGSSCGNPKMSDKWEEQWRWIYCANGYETEWLVNAEYSCGCEDEKGGGN